MLEWSAEQIPDPGRGDQSGDIGGVCSSFSNGSLPHPPGVLRLPARPLISDGLVDDRAPGLIGGDPGAELELTDDVERVDCGDLTRSSRASSASMQKLDDVDLPVVAAAVMVVATGDTEEEEEEDSLADDGSLVGEIISQRVQE